MHQHLRRGSCRLLFNVLHESAMRTRHLVLVGTLGRLIVHVRNGLDYALGVIEVLVIDIAHRLLDTGFKDDVEEIERYIPRRRETNSFSKPINSGVGQAQRSTTGREQGCSAAGTGKTHIQDASYRLLPPKGYLPSSARNSRVAGKRDTGTFLLYSDLLVHGLDIDGVQMRVPTISDPAFRLRW